MREQTKEVATQLVSLCEAYIAKHPAAETETIDIAAQLLRTPEILQERESRPERKAIRQFLEGLPVDDLRELTFEMYRGRGDAGPEDELRSGLGARGKQALVATLLEKTRAIPRYLGRRLQDS